MAAIMGFAPSKIAITVISLCLALYLVFTLGPETPSISIPARFRAKRIDDIPHALSDIQNSTLGFEKIIILNLPERGDKRDALSLAASLTNMTFDYVAGVHGADVVNKSLPHGQEGRTIPEAMLGSWRGHMNAIRLIVEQRLSSALIMEDDIDWDVNIKRQLVDFARGTRWLQNTAEDARTHSPYGDDWDLLWVGHCHDSLDKEDNRTFVVPDQTVPRVDQLKLNNPELLRPWPDHSRVVHRVGGPICTFAYALSYRGAQKVLWSLSVRRLRGLFDNALSWWCTDREQNALCLSAHPTHFTSHRAAGGPGKNSDNQKASAGSDKPWTINTRWATRMNIEELLMGLPLHDYYPLQGPAKEP